MRRAPGVFFLLGLMLPVLLAWMSWHFLPILRLAAGQLPPGTLAKLGVIERCWELETGDHPKSTRDLLIAGRRLEAAIELASANAFEIQMASAPLAECRSMVALADWLELHGNYAEAERHLIAASACPLIKSDLSAPDILGRLERVRRKREALGGDHRMKGDRQ